MDFSWAQLRHKSQKVPRGNSWCNCLGSSEIVYNSFCACMLIHVSRSINCPQVVRLGEVNQRANLKNEKEKSLKAKWPRSPRSDCSDLPQINWIGTSKKLDVAPTPGSYKDCLTNKGPLKKQAKVRPTLIEPPNEPPRSARIKRKLCSQMEAVRITTEA